MAASRTGRIAAVRSVGPVVPVLLIVWVLCVVTDWSDGTKLALNLAAVSVLCLREHRVHRSIRRDAFDPTCDA